MAREKMPKFEYRVVWKRRACTRRVVKVVKRTTAERLADYQRGLDSDDFDDERIIQPLEYCVIEERRVGPWEAMVL